MFSIVDINTVNIKYLQLEDCSGQSWILPLKFSINYHSLHYCEGLRSLKRSMDYKIDRKGRVEANDISHVRTTLDWHNFYSISETQLKLSTDF